MRLAAVSFLIALPAVWATTITGTFKTPNGSAFNGKIQISLAQSTATNTCPDQPSNFSQVMIKITAGAMQSINLAPSPCLSPASGYNAVIYDQAGNLIYRTVWTVPNKSAADVTELEPSK
jgi:hypothetical protein